MLREEMKTRGADKLQCGFTVFTGTDTNDVGDIIHKDFAISNLSG